MLYKCFVFAGDVWLRTTGPVSLRNRRELMFEIFHRHVIKYLKWTSNNVSAVMSG